MQNKIILLGKGAGGKDFLKKALIDNYGYKAAVSCTTRPPRENEVDGIDYHFITEDLFQEMIKNNQFKEYNCFGANKWYYGTRISDFDSATVFIMTPSGIKALTPAERSEFYVVYLDIAEDVRRTRLMSRNDADDAERRLHTDRIDFEGFNDFDLKVTIPDFDPADIVECVRLATSESVVVEDDSKTIVLTQ